MVLMVVCDCCKKSFALSDTIEIVDYKGTHWFRCEQCVVSFGEKPRSDPYYAELYSESILKGGNQFGDANFNYPKEKMYSKTSKKK